MRKNVIETVMGAVVLIVAIAFVFTAFQSTRAGMVDGYRVTMELADASGVVRGTDVRMAGVKVGSVVDQVLDSDTYFATIVMEIDDRIRLPSDSKVRVLPDGLLGGYYVQISPGSAKEVIANGGKVVDAEGPVNVVDLISKTIFLAVEHVQEDTD